MSSLVICTNLRLRLALKNEGFGLFQLSFQNIIFCRRFRQQENDVLIEGVSPDNSEA